MVFCVWRQKYGGAALVAFGGLFCLQGGVVLSNIANIS